MINPAPRRRKYQRFVEREIMEFSTGITRIISFTAGPGHGWSAAVILCRPGTEG
jgi:hypothetical protein